MRISLRLASRRQPTLTDERGEHVRDLSIHWLQYPCARCFELLRRSRFRELQCADVPMRILEHVLRAIRVPRTQH